MPKTLASHRVALHDSCDGPTGVNMPHFSWFRRIMRAPFISVFLFTFLVVAACSNVGMAGPAEQGAIGQGLRGVAQNPVVPIRSHEKTCQLCNEGGYCLDFDDKSSCEINKSVVEKKDATIKWKTCTCHH